MLYYQGYEITGKYGYLEEEELHVLYACHWMVDNHSTIYEAALYCEYSATTLWRKESIMNVDNYLLNYMDA